MMTMRIIITGSHGGIGSAVAAHLAKAGHVVLRAARGLPRSQEEVAWDVLSGRLDPPGADAVIHLAGESLSGRWTRAKMRAIRDSRIGPTAALARAVAGWHRPPGLLMTASATGFYGSRGDEELTEDSPGGQGFLAEVCRDWEAAAAGALRAGVRVVNMRLGMVLYRGGGALAAMLGPKGRRPCARLGSGMQYWSWVHRDDVVRAVEFIMRQERLEGAVNVTSPRPVVQKEMALALAQATGRRLVVPVPRTLVRLLMGKMAGETLLASQRVLPRRLLQGGFAFERPNIQDALEAQEPEASGD
jgi:uncharacterized protein (TIGR01777 family)